MNNALNVLDFASFPPRARELVREALLIATEQLKRDAAIARDFAPRSRADLVAGELEDKRRQMLELYTRLLNAR